MLFALGVCFTSLAFGPQKTFADCVGPPGQVAKAQALKVQAETARDAGNFDQAAELYKEAAAAHPKSDVVASYLMNAVGALVGTWDDQKGWRWDSDRGPGNLDEAAKILEQASVFLSKADAERCFSEGVDHKSLQAWISTQRRWLTRMSATGGS